MSLINVLILTYLISIFNILLPCNTRILSWGKSPIPEDIKKICLVNYNVGFITSKPINVKGENAHPIFSWIKEKYNKSPKWNFYKYLFNRSGNLTDTWSSMTKPDSTKITIKIDKLI